MEKIFSESILMEQIGALEVDEVKEMALRDENAQLKRVVVDQALNIHLLKIANSKREGRSQQRHTQVFAASGVLLS